MEMLTEHAKAKMTKQQYRIVGGHSAVKVCGWTKNMIKGQGGCYKLKFYGIMSNQCLQMTPSMSCANRCSFCWRDYKAPVSKDWKWDVDDPEMIIEESLHHQKKLLEGFGGNEKAIPQAFEASKDVQHVALSLNGEPITYPRMNELVAGFHKRGISTFLVTNGQHPGHLKDLDPITQLYISVDAPNPKLLKEIDNPLFSNYWEKLQESLDGLAAKEQRTTIRLTVMHGYNDVEPENYAKLILRGDADFIEIKGYMHVGASINRLSRDNMPEHEHVRNFAKQVAQYLPDYEIVSEHLPSRVILLAKKKFFIEGTWWTWIDYPKFTELVNSGKSFRTEEYMAKTPKPLLGIADEESVAVVDEEKKDFMTVSEQGNEEDLD
jgi:tRNA wybutosine-synthesizing protein 1